MPITFFGGLHVGGVGKKGISITARLALCQGAAGCLGGSILLGGFVRLWYSGLSVRQEWTAATKREPWTVYAVGGHFG